MSENMGRDKSLRNRSFDPEKYGMVACPDCKSNGYIWNPMRQCCPNCRGFGFVRKENEACNREAERG
jgi:uncharacterized protein YbaR (Trm112 family)